MQADDAGQDAVELAQHRDEPRDGDDLAAVAVIRGLRAKGGSLRRIGKHPDVQLSAAMVHEILKAGLPLSAVNGMVAAAAAAAGDDDDVESNGEPDALDGLSDVLRAELLTLTSSGSVRLAHWRAWHHDVSAELYAWLNREYARLGLIAGVGRGSVSSTRSRAARPYP